MNVFSVDKVTFHDAVNVIHDVITNIILRVTAYSGELLSPTSVTKTGYTGFWLVYDINRRKLVTSSENSEQVTSSVRYQRIQNRIQGCGQEFGGRMEGFIQDGNESSTKPGSLI